MAIRPSHIKDKTGLETNTREARHARLRSLADSINDTARMARNSLSLLLIVTLYLGLTLVASTDENLLRNGQVVLPQVGVGLSIVQSYIFAPLIFLYLHAQLLFLLAVLARKVRTFEVTLEEEFPDTVSSNIQERVEAKREECRDWLSAFAFVQLLSLRPGVLPGSKILVWLGAEAIPVVLLFVLDLSFVRYQSNVITWVHHFVFSIDLLFLMWFNEQVFGEGPQRLRTLLSAMAMKILRRPRTSNHERTPRAERRPWEVRGQAMTLAWLAVLLGMYYLLFFAAHPPSFNLETVEKDREGIWGKNGGFWEAVWNGENPLDAGPCKWLGFACRYLDVSNKRLAKTQGQDRYGPKSDEPSDESFTTIDLAGRNLRFAHFQDAWLQGVNLSRAELQGADLWRARLQDANLFEAQLQGVDLSRAQLQGADLLGAQLQGANLSQAELQDADLFEAQLQGANLSQAELQDADLLGAQLQGADLSQAQLQGANLWFGGLQCANLQKAHLQGVDLRGAQLQGSFGTFSSWYLVDTLGVLCDFPTDKLSPEQYLETLVTNVTATVKLAWETGMSVGEHLQECINEDWDHRVHLPSNSAQPDWNTWAEWTTKFSCENEYTARSSLKRWVSESIAPSGLEDSDKALVRKALATARTTKTEEECPGLHSIPDDEWKEFVGS